MSTITAILEPEADGVLHLPVPEEWISAKVKVVATLETAETKESASANLTVDSLRRIAARGGLGSISDPIRWQRKIRKDRVLPGREP